MKKTYIARQAVFNRKLETIGYELFFRDSAENQFPEVDQDIASSKLIIQNHIQSDIQTLCMGKLAFINFTENNLIHKFPLMFDKNLIVIELVGNKQPSTNLVKIVKYYHEHGYKIALTEYDLALHWDVLFPYIDIVKVNIEKINTKRLSPAVVRMKTFDISIVAERVETRNQQQTLAEVGFNYFQGYFYHQTEMIEGQALTTVKTMMLQLLSETSHSTLDFGKVSQIISQDVNLTIGLLKMVNNVSTGTDVEIECLRQAATYLGEEKLRQLIAILALSNLTSDKADEVCKQALITGRMMQTLSAKNNFSSVKEFAFITGLLSSIEVILSMPVSEILKTMPLAKPIEKALIANDGVLGDLLNLTTTFISDNNQNIQQLITTHGLSNEIIQQEFLDACQWCHALELSS
ncbi:EAL and HDOD domain-containing protein [Colwellia psychrerythraea]|uniref:Diguanylate phosphodiesterase metal dependent hydrolase domain containing protein n=1 Tax=Colwellia psychrerythraea TaxID=28229 RepID=A0A099KTP2_COLPS|nr:HDOD domain-containing protein [Colwellia psychrerythraea]KGJ93931.1 diguanylate phosphodiesterase metal dependent hydrolase domain containing protein [Colwellia psychrerythraea]